MNGKLKVGESRRFGFLLGYSVHALTYVTLWKLESRCTVG